MKILKKAESGEPISYGEARQLFELNDSLSLFSAARFVARENFGNKISLYKNAFPPVSVTGDNCSLNCHHCSRQYLKHMAPATTNEQLVKHCLLLQKRGVPGIVLSGGSRADGVVPLCEFSKGIAEVKRQTNLDIFAHTGPANERQVSILDKAGLDCALLDVIGSSKTVEKVFGVRISQERYKRTIEALKKSEIKLSPHVIVGLDYGKINGEIKALELLRDACVDNICIIVLIPTKNTPMEGILPPSPETIGRIVAIAKLMYPDVPVSLGCVRPGKTYRQAIDAAAINAGATKIAIPSLEAKRAAEELGLKIVEFEQMCCA